MPKNKIIKKDNFDKFYTKPEISVLCYERLLPYIKDELIIEPSAGNCSFYNIIRDPKIGYDILPECPNIIKENWFNVVVPDDCIILGNPPFGNRNDLSKKFIIHSLNNAKCIAFILPMVFKKETLQSIFPDNWILVDYFDLPVNSFTLNNVDYHVPTVFQIWINKNKYENIYNDLRESIKPEIIIDDFAFTTDIDKSDYFIFGAAPYKIIQKQDVTKNNRGYYIINNTNDLISRFNEIDWKKYSLSSVNGGVSWFTKKQILFAYYDTYYKG
jgi:hypothetical protein